MPATFRVDSPGSTTAIWLRSLLLSAALLLAGALSIWLTPGQALTADRPAPVLGQIVPRQFGAWREDSESRLALVAPDVAAELDRVYGQTLERIYVNAQGQRIMLAIAYGSRQFGNDLQAHRPEYCYQAQGFELLQTRDDWLDLQGQRLPLRRLLARQHQRHEPISYWMTVGDQAARPGPERKLLQLRYGLQGRIPDGMLVRVSSLDRNSAVAWERQAGFIAELHRAAPLLFGQTAAATASR